MDRWKTETCLYLPFVNPPLVPPETLSASLSLPSSFSISACNFNLSIPSFLPLSFTGERHFHPLTFNTFIMQIMSLSLSLTLAPLFLFQNIHWIEKRSNRGMEGKMYHIYIFKCHSRDTEHFDQSQCLTASNSSSHSFCCYLFRFAKVSQLIL